MTRETIQEHINKRAADKLDKEIKSNLLKHLDKITYKEFTDQFPPDKFTWRMDGMFGLSNITGEWILKKIKEQLLPQYISNETILFLKEIEELKEKVKSLEGQTDELLNTMNY